MSRPNHTSRPPKRLRRLTRIWDKHNRYFLTICVQDRCPVLAQAEVHDRVRRFVAESMSRYGIWVYAYVLMPDHIHLIVSISPESVRLGQWVKAFKAMVSRRTFQWQSGFFDHVLRSEESISEKWEYIRMNPVRASLVVHPEEWGYSGFFDPQTGREMQARSPACPPVVEPGGIAPGEGTRPTAVIG